MVHSKFSSGVKIVNVFHALHYHHLKTEVGETGANGQNAHVHVVLVYLSLQDNVIIQCLDLMGNFALERELGIILFSILAHLKNDFLTEQFIKFSDIKFVIHIHAIKRILHSGMYSVQNMIIQHVMENL